MPNLVVMCRCFKSRTAADDWTTHLLTKDEEARQTQLLNEIREQISAKDDLAGKPAANYAELLSLADKTQTDGSKTSYAYNVLSGGDVQEPCHAIIIVGDGKILQACWPHGEF